MRYQTNLCFFYKQPVYKQLALEWQIAKQLSGLNPSFTKQQSKLQIKEKWSFSFVINKKIAAKPTIHQNYHQSLNHHWANFKITYHKCQFWILKIILFLLGQTTKQLISNFEPQKPWKYKQLLGAET